MAEDTEKKFHSIMNKLFQSPKSNLSPSPNAQKKRPYSGMEFNFKRGKTVGNSSAAKAPSCRPWDRGDLMRRLATFKSMRWFAKPKAVDAVNCARRGWVNVYLDIIACEICGARLQFSTPSAWNQQQVEKAALVFSLKLDSGHKLLCPWIDNSCDESLAPFPPMPTQALVEQYKERSCALLRLSALPVISDTAMKSMRNPHLGYFLKHSIEAECGARPNDSSQPEYLGSDTEAVSGDLYYQAHRLLSLCGWEPRLLPYMVDSSDQGTEPVVSGEQNNKLCVYISCSSEDRQENEDHASSNVYYDPNSTVLDCKLCGSSIGLWTFATVQRPLELVRVVGLAEIGGGGNSGGGSGGSHCASNGKSDLSAAIKVANVPRETTLNLTIAGGPPPTKQNFRAMISLPIVCRNVRARFSDLSSEVRNSSAEGHKSHNTNAEGSTVNFQNEEIRSGPPDTNGTSNGNGAQSTLPSTAVHETTDQQSMDTETTVSTKEQDASIVSSGEQMDKLQKDVTSESIVKDLRRHSSDKMEFHPIRQHRHFCPWIALTDTTAPGWQQTLLALQKEKMFSVPDNEASPSSPSLIKADDPITSIRKLFESPPAKRARPALT